jgi:hypothetical protein
MRRPALVLGLVALLAAAAIWGVPYLTRGRDYFAATPQPRPLFAVTTIPLRPGQRACMNDAVIDRYSEQANLLVGTYRRAAQPLELSLSGGGYYATSRVPGDYPDSLPFEVPVRPPARPLETTICLRNAGERQIALYASYDRTRSRSPVLVDGRPVGPGFVVYFTERRPVSILDRLGVSLRRASAFRAFGVSPVTLWPLLILFVVGVPLAVLLTFVRSLGDVTTGRPPQRRS